MSAVRLDHKSSQIVVIGSGLPGSITALVLAKLGFQVVVIDKTAHPRFAIGESSTPIADAYLARIATEFDVPELLPLSTFAQTRDAYPDLDVGRKRGFSYFWHEKNYPFIFEEQHQFEMAVAASPNDELSDSNWLRSDVDSQIASWFGIYGVQLLDNCEIQSITRKESKWKFSIRRNSQNAELTTEYFIDASGSTAVGIRAMGGTSKRNLMWTNTSAIFAHFDKLKRWSEKVPISLRTDYPYRCDDAAVHQLIQDGWMWQLRFESGRTSCGIVQANDRTARIANLVNSATSGNSTEALSLFRDFVQEYPSLADQFADAKVVTPEKGAYCRQRLQHWFDRGSGQNWCALPNTVGFVDPMHSKGMAHALSGVYRLAHLFAANGQDMNSRLDQRVEKLSQDIQDEIQYLDRLIALCYLSLDSFELFRMATFWYFAAATNFEDRSCKQNSFARPFLLVDDADFRSSLFTYADQLKLHSGNVSQKHNEMLPLAKKLLEPYDQVGLFDPPIPNMYWNTSAPEGAKTL